MSQNPFCPQVNGWMYACLLTAIKYGTNRPAIPICQAKIKTGVFGGEFEAIKMGVDMLRAKS
ncbi:hypothetical protein ACHAXS_001622 [Conticribra weissflogii]